MALGAPSQEEAAASRCGLLVRESDAALLLCCSRHACPFSANPSCDDGRRAYARVKGATQQHGRLPAAARHTAQVS